MTDRVFSLDRDGRLRRLQHEPYNTEDILQRLLAHYPDLLAGDEMDAGAPKRWLFVARECGVPGEDGGSNRWALDHLFIDQDAVPTLVEVKLSSDSRIRREVVGQMLDYAANAVAYWPVETLRALFATACAERGDDPADVVSGLLASEQPDDVERFWGQVKTNLQAGRVRLVFVADEVPPELRRIVEFLNTQMDPAEVLAVEVRQFVGEHHNTLVPTVIGRTSAAQRKKGSGRDVGEKWTAKRYFDQLEALHGHEVETIARHLLEWITPLVSRVWWGEGKVDGAYVPILELQGGVNRGGQSIRFFIPYTYGSVEIQFQSLNGKPGFVDEGAQLDLMARLNALPGIVLPADGIDRRPSFPIEALLNPETLSGFKQAIEWAIERVKSAAAVDTVP